MGGRGLAAVLDAIRDNFTLAADAEVSTEANPNPRRPRSSATSGGRIHPVSLGMQSASTRVLKLLDQVHSPGRPVEAAREARAAGFEHVNLDLDLWHAGESDDDLMASLDAVPGRGVDHVSAYALIVEEGTALARRVRRGDIARPDDDVLAQRVRIGRCATVRCRTQLVRGVQLEPPGAGMPAQPRILERRQMVGRRTGSAQLHGRHPLVERQTPRHLRRSPEPRRVPDSRFRNASQSTTGTSKR